MGPQVLAFASRNLKNVSFSSVSSQKEGLHRAITGVLRGFDGFDPFEALKVLARLLTPEAGMAGTLLV